MTNKTIYFLAGLPRTGSTLLGSILSQNPRIHVTPTSPLYPLLVAINEEFNLLNVQYTFDQVVVGDRVYHAVVDAFYNGIKQPLVFDKHRGWPKHVPAIAQYINSKPRIICTIRPIVEIITSYLVLADKDPDNFIDAHLKRLDKDITNKNRADLLWTTYLQLSYKALIEGMSISPDSILFVEYYDIVFNIAKTLQRIYNFCNISTYKHRVDGIENKCAEAKDEAWGLKNLHTIRQSLSMQSSSPLVYLSTDEIEYYTQFDIKAN